MFSNYILLRLTYVYLQNVIKYSALYFSVDKYIFALYTLIAMTIESAEYFQHRDSGSGVSEEGKRNSRYKYKIAINST